MAMIGIAIALVTIAITIIGLIFKVSFYAAEQRLMLQQMQGELALVRHIPIMVFRITRLEQEVGISHIEMPIVPPPPTKPNA